MKRFTTLMLGTALAAAVTFAAQTPAAGTSTNSSTPAPAASVYLEEEPPTAEIPIIRHAAGA